MVTFDQHLYLGCMIFDATRAGAAGTHQLAILGMEKRYHAAA